MFDCMGALSTKRNNDPTKASRAFDKDRDGFVIAGTQCTSQFTCFTRTKVQILTAEGVQAAVAC
jgi:hypothetical protein